MKLKEQLAERAVQAMHSVPAGRHESISTVVLRICSHNNSPMSHFVSLGADLGNLSPAVAVLLVCFDEATLLLMGPALLVDVGAQLVVPALAKLLSNATIELGKQLAPVAHTMLLHQPTGAEDQDQ